MAIRNLAILSIAVALFSASACSGDDDSNGTTGGTGGSSAGKAGAAGKSGSGGTAGKGGSSGSAGKAGHAGANETGGTGQAGTGESGAGQGGASAGEGGIGGAGGSVGDLTDGEVLQIVMTINSGESDMAAIALTSGTGTDVEAFAGKMISEHNAYNQAAMTLGTDQHITPEDSPANQAVKTKGDEAVARLNAAANSSDADFDAVYADTQVLGHEDALNVIDHELVPTAENAALKTYLGMLRDTVATHLDDARTLAHDHPL